MRQTDHKTVHLILRVQPKFKAFVEDASDRAGMTLSDWMRAVLARAANEGAFAPRKVGKKRERTTTS